MLSINKAPEETFSLDDVHLNSAGTRLQEALMSSGRKLSSLIRLKLGTSKILGHLGALKQPLDSRNQPVDATRNLMLKTKANQIVLKRETIRKDQRVKGEK